MVVVCSKSRQWLAISSPVNLLFTWISSFARSMFSALLNVDGRSERFSSITLSRPLVNCLHHHFIICTYDLEIINMFESCADFWTWLSTCPFILCHSKNISYCPGFPFNVPPSPLWSGTLFPAGVGHTNHYAFTICNKKCTIIPWGLKDMPI